MPSAGSTPRPPGRNTLQTSPLKFRLNETKNARTTRRSSASDTLLNAFMIFLNVSFLMRCRRGSQGAGARGAGGAGRAVSRLAFSTALSQCRTLGFAVDDLSILRLFSFIFV